MIIDMHMHESTCSSDSFLKLADIVETAKGLGLDAICITDHDHMGLKEFAQNYSKEVDFPIFVGVEYYSLQGDIVAFGINDFPKERISAQEFIDSVHEQGGVCFAAHPFRNNNRGLAEHLWSVEGLDAIEAFNASTTYEANVQALEVSIKRGIQAVGVSDCHVMEKIGVYATCLPYDVKTLDEFVAAFKKGDCYPVGYFDGEYIDLRKVVAMMTPESALIPIDKQKKK